MKTKELFLGLVLIFALVFTSKAQTITQTPGIVQNWTGDVDMSISPNREYVVVAGDNLQILTDNNGNPYVDGTPGDEGWWKKFHRNGDKTFSLVDEGPLYKGSGGSASVIIEEGKSVAVSNTGVAYIYFDSDMTENTIVKDGIVAHLLTGEATQGGMYLINGYLYMIIGDNISFCELWKVDIATDQILYQTSYPAGIGQSVKSIQKMPDGNIAVEFSGSGAPTIQKFDESNGNHLGLFKTINYGSKFKFANGRMEYLTNDEINRGKILEGPNFDQVVNETNFPFANFFEDVAGLEDWKIINGIFYGAGGGNAYLLDAKLRHGYRRPLSGNTYGDLLKSYLYGENEYIFFTKQGNDYHILNVVDDGGDPVATINLSHPDIVDGRDGMTYDNGWQADYSHVSTLVFADNNLPSVGYTPEENWLNHPNNFPDYGATQVKDTIVNSKTLLFYDVQYTSGWQNVVRMRIFLNSESTVGVQDFTEIGGNIYPNPTNEILNFESSQNIERITVYNIKGQKVLERKFNNANNQYQIDISKLAKGTYIAEIKGKNGVKTGKFIVK